MNNEWFIILRNIAFIFATLMLLKYFIFLVLAPFYSVREELRIKKNKKKQKNNTDPLVSIIIPAWNEEVGIIKSIDSLFNNSYKKIEIIVVNDGSTDKTEKVVKRLIRDNKTLDVSIKYYFKKNGGKGSALNHGIDKAGGDIIITMDADSVFEKDVIKNFTKYFIDKDISAVVGNVRIANKNNIVGMMQKLEYIFGFYFKRTHAVLGAEYIFGGACSAFRREVFEEIGNYCTTNKAEDIEMSMRTKLFGLKSAYAENAVCWTEGASNIEGLVNQRLRWKKGRFDTFMKYRNIFFSIDKKHNTFLSWFILPYSLLSEAQLLYEPIAISLLITYSFVSGDYLSLALGASFIFIIYLVNALFSGVKVKVSLLFLYPLTWPLFYILLWVEYIALLKSLKLVIRGDDVVWQKWQRKGIDNI